MIENRGGYSPIHRKETMKYLIAVAVILFSGFVIGFVISADALDVCPEEQEKEDRDRTEYYLSWGEKRRRS